MLQLYTGTYVPGGATSEVNEGKERQNSEISESARPCVITGGAATVNRLDGRAGFSYAFE